MLFSIWLRPRYKIPVFFTIARVFISTLTVCRRNRSDPSSLRLRVSYKYYKNSRLGLAWSRPRGLSWPTSVFRITYVCAKCYPDRLRFGSTRAKTCFELNRAPSIRCAQTRNNHKNKTTITRRVRPPNGGRNEANSWETGSEYSSGETYTGCCNAGRRPAPACGLARPAGPRWPLPAGIYQRRSRRIG